MTSYALKRLLWSVPLFVVITALCFALLQLAPGEPLASDPALRAEDIERRKQALGLDRPAMQRYVGWLGGLVRGDLGQSLVRHEPVGALIRARMPATLELVAASVILSLVAGIAIGVVSAANHGRWIDHLLNGVALVGLSVPVFWLGVLAILLFALQLGWLPSGSRSSIGLEGNWIDRLQHLVLPACVLAAAQAPVWGRSVRASMVEVLAEDHVRTARAKGLSERQVLLRHALRPALVPVVTLLGIQVPALFTGMIMTETVFAWPGIGRLFYEGVQNLDDTLLMGVLALSTALILGGNWLADVANAKLDPRLRLGARL